MAIVASTEIIAAERLNDGLVIKFDDGKCAFYSALLLRATFAQARELDETRTDW